MEWEASESFIDTSGQEAVPKIRAQSRVNFQKFLKGTQKNKSASESLETSSLSLQLIRFVHKITKFR